MTSEFTEISQSDEFAALHLFERIQIADHYLPMIQSQYRVVFEDPENEDYPCGILIPDPHWLAQALHGYILPPIEAELEDQKAYKTYLDEGNDPQKFDWHNVDGGAKHPYVKPIGPMTEEEAIEYLIMKCLPQRVWVDHDRSNKRRFKIVQTKVIPTDRKFRQAWRLDNE